MNVFYDTLEAEGKLNNTVVTTGSFDGVHIGHKIIINRMKELAESIQGESTLVTFHPHPRKVLYPEQKDLKLINSQEEKIDLLSKTGLHNLIIIPFTKEFSKTTSSEFISDILIKQLSAKIVIVGKNHHFGHNRSGDYAYLHELSKNLNFGVEEIPLKDIENETVSSTKIRKALLQGNIMRANAYLDHQYIIHGKFMRSPNFAEMQDINFFTTKITEEEKLIPPNGMYATNVLLEGKFLKSMTIIHEFGQGKSVDTVLLHDKTNLDLSGATIYFHKKMRGEKAVAVYDDFLKDEMAETMEEVEELLY
ncbi:MAG: adenylyltransferase/cytidyltransferase family protein [Bacteroidota bacterium]